MKKLMICTLLLLGLAGCVVEPVGPGYGHPYYGHPCYHCGYYR